VPEIQIALTYTCKRCGRPMPSLPDLAETALRVVDALQRMKLAIPDVASTGIRILAVSLPCHAGLCKPRPEVEA
jgi:hypothetical protein